MGVNIDINNIMKEIKSTLTKELDTGIEFELCDIYINYKKDAITVDKNSRYSVVFSSDKIANKYNIEDFNNYTKKFSYKSTPSKKALFINAKDLYNYSSSDISDNTFIYNFIKAVLSTVKLINSNPNMDCLPMHVVNELTDTVFNKLNK